jgi:hypothetical protein
MARVAVVGNSGVTGVAVMTDVGVAVAFVVDAPFQTIL